MKARLIFVVAGLLGMAVGPGCSEKQKEAARLEAAMKMGDTVATSGSEQSQDTLTGLPKDSTTLVTSGETAQSPTDISSDSIAAQSKPDLPQMTGGDVTEPPVDTVNRVQPDTTDTIEQVLDAGAIPDEERMRQSGQAAASDQSARTVGTGYVIQISSTPDQKEANALAAKYIRNGYHSFVTEAFIDGTTYFRVRIGRYNSMAEAEGVLTELNQKFGVSGFVTQVK